MLTSEIVFGVYCARRFVISLAKVACDYATEKLFFQSHFQSHSKQSGIPLFVGDKIFQKKYCD